MFRRIEASGYRCLRSVKQSINPFEILIGSNASGKSTFLDVIAFLGTLVSGGLEAAVEQRTANFHDLVWGRDADRFSLAVEAVIPEDRRFVPSIPPIDFVASDRIRYEVGVRIDVSTEKLEIEKERVMVYRAGVGLPPSETEILRRPAFSSSSPGMLPGPPSVELRSETSNRVFQREIHRGYSSLPPDTDFPATAWLREHLRAGIKPVALDNRELRKPSPPAMSDASEWSGAFLARSVAQLKSRNAGRFDAWLSHVRTVLPDIKDIRTVVREDDRHRYVVIGYENGVSVPSWMVSDGTLRLLALTLLAYAPDFNGVYLIEEPENGVHPAAVQAIYESLSSVYEGQVLIASHSPVLLSLAKPEQLLCFIKASDGTQIVRGSEHQALRDWQGEVSLGTLAASGILG